MTGSRLQRALQRALLAGTPLTLAGCFVGSSSCPDDGREPPRLEKRAVSPTLAGGAELDAAACEQACSEPSGTNAVITCVREAPESVLCVLRPFPCEGRRPAGLEPAVALAQSGFDFHLSAAAWLEAASVDAFRGLRRELRAHGAPRRLLRAASRSARDERRHARAARSLARRFGAPLTPLECSPAMARGLPELAVENAVEGCVRETWGALIALHQAARATEPSVRSTMRRIARDEVRHAELAFRIDRWLTPRLTPAQRGRVRAARAAALDQLKRELGLALPAPERTRLGLPDAPAAAAMLGELTRCLRLDEDREPSTQAPHT